jgi:hypothetical protein
VNTEPDKNRKKAVTGDRRKPVKTSETSTTRYPSGHFSLQRDEIFPYERYAYNVLSLAVEAFDKRGLPVAITVDLTQGRQRASPWVINASIEYRLNGKGNPEAFIFRMPELVPAIIYLFTATIVSDLFHPETFGEIKNSPSKLRERFQHFSAAVNAGIQEYRTLGFAHGVRAAYQQLGLTIGTLAKSTNDFDLLSKQMAFHEIAHGYVKQVTREGTTTAEKAGFELIADLVATEWFYNQMIANTPDSEEYRNWRGANSHAESIFLNALTSLQSQQALLALMAVAGAQRAGGTVSLKGGEVHPSGLQRYMLQHVHLFTLIASNFSALLSPQHLQALQDDWDEKLDVLVLAGVIPTEDIATILDTRECDTIESAANNTLSPGAFALASSASRGPQKSPDYIVEDSNGNFSVLECKGGQCTRKDLLAAMERGVPQKANVQAIGATQLQHSLVAGLFIPQFEGSDAAAIVIGDPEWEDFQERLSPFSQDEIGRAISQVAHAKELAILGLPNTANTLVRAEESEESIRNAIRRDLSWEGTPGRHMTNDGLSMVREYRWSDTARLADNLQVSGIRFRGSLPMADTESLRAAISPTKYGEQKHGSSSGNNWILRSSDTSASLRSPFGASFELSLLEV